ncbi:hypothetical protein, partial [Methylobacterium sp. J-092]|uniref:hypothetical protein n=1 Tax=Methylobacterium sp. J-092 TaxID=2836667 RepID=UPI001FB9CDCF
MTAPSPQRAASAEERERHEPTDAEMLAEIAAEEAARKASPRTVAPIPVRARYFLMECEHCGWVGSSELCGTNSGGDDSDIYCPACDAMTLGDEPSEADAAKFGQAILDRITAAEARAEEAEKDRTALTKALTGLTWGGSEFFTRRGEDFIANAKACVENVRARMETRQRALIREADRRNVAEADRDRLADEVARLRGALERSADTLNACEGVMRNAGDIAAAMEASVEE